MHAYSDIYQILGETRSGWNNDNIYIAYSFLFYFIYQPKPTME